MRCNAMMVMQMTCHVVRCNVHVVKSNLNKHVMYMECHDMSCMHARTHTCMYVYMSCWLHTWLFLGLVTRILAEAWIDENLSSARIPCPESPKGSLQTCGMPLTPFRWGCRWETHAQASFLRRKRLYILKLA